MADYMEQITELEKELSNTKYNKRTQGHIGLVKANLTKLPIMLMLPDHSMNGMVITII